MQKLVDKYNTTIKVQASVIGFYYDYDCGTKFLTLDDGEQIIDAIIFEDTKVPFIEVGNSYSFIGLYHKYENNVQLQIYS